MEDDFEGQLGQLEQKCDAICRGFPWLSPKGAPNYRLVYSHPSTFKPGARFMLLGINPGGDPSAADIHPAGLPLSREGYSAYLDESWQNNAPATYRLQTVAQQVASTFAGSQRAGNQLLRESPTGNMIPFRSRGVSEIPKPLWFAGIPIGHELVKIAQPRVLVLLGSDATLFDRLLSEVYAGSVVQARTAPYGANQTYRDAVVGTGHDRTFIFALPQRALQKALTDFTQRLDDLNVRTT